MSAIGRRLDRLEQAERKRAGSVTVIQWPWETEAEAMARSGNPPHVDLFIQHTIIDPPPRDPVTGDRLSAGSAQ